MAYHISFNNRGTYTPGAIAPLQPPPPPPPSGVGIGFDLAGIGYSDPTLPFINIMKQGGAEAGIGATAAYNWITLPASGGDTREEYLLNLDSDGYPLQIPQPGLTSTKVRCLLNWSLPLPAGVTFPYAQANTQYAVLYDGAGTLVVGGQGGSDATATITASGQTFTVATPSQGLSLDITSSTNGNHVRNVRVVEASLLPSFNSGAIFHPNFLAKAQGAGCIRFMGWLQGYKQLIQVQFSATPAVGATSATVTGFYWGGAGGPDPAIWHGPTGTYVLTFSDGEQRTATLTNGASTCNWVSGGGALTGSQTKAYAYMSVVPSWAQRPVPTQAFYGSSDIRGAPIEVCIALANALNANPWITVPLFYSDADIQALATLVKSLLNPGLVAYFELSNEVWNGAYLEQEAAQFAGKGTWSGLASDFEYNRNWFGMRTAVMAELIKGVYGASFSSSAVVVLGAQVASTYSATDSMATPAWTAPIDGFTGPASAHPIGAIAIAPYFPANLASDMSTTDAANIKAQSDGGLNYLGQLLRSNVVTGGSAPGTYSSVPANGYLGQAESEINAYLAIMPNYPGVKLVGYEGGQQYDGGFPSASPLGNTLIQQFNQSAAMGGAYTDFINYWQVNVGAGPANVLNLVNLIDNNTGNFCFGIWDSVQQTVAPTKAAAVEAFIP